MSERFEVKKNGSKWTVYDDGLKAGEFKTEKSAQAFVEDISNTMDAEVLDVCRELSMKLSDSTLADSEYGRILDVALTNFITAASE